MELSSEHALRAWLDYRDMSYADLAGYVGCSKQFIGYLATGKKKTCTPALAERIEQVLLPAPEKRSPTELPLFVPRGYKPVRRRKRRTETVGSAEQAAV